MKTISMLSVLRVMNFFVGAILAASVVMGIMDIELFIVPDLILAVGLMASALVPSRVADRALLASSGFATGVFTVAVTRYVIDGETVNPPLIVMLIIVAGTMAWLLMQTPKETRGG